IDPGRPHGTFSLQFIDRVTHGFGQPGDSGPLGQQLGVVAAQRGERVRLRVDRRRDVGQAEAQLTEQQDLLEAQQFPGLVEPVAVRSRVGRGQQADRVVVAQRPGGDPGHPGHFSDRPGHRSTIGVDVTSTSTSIGENEHRDKAGGHWMSELKVEIDPAEGGLDPERLQRIGQQVGRYVDDGQLPGWLITVNRRGQLAYVAQSGVRDLASGRPVETDTLWRIYSMSKPMTSVAAMILWEEGGFELNDPVSKFIPAFADVRVFTGGTDVKQVTVPAAEPVRVWHLLTHTS